MALSKINTNQIVDGAVATADIADGLITTAKLADGAVTTAKITDGNITTAKVADDAVTTAKVNPAQTDITSVGTLTGLTTSGDIDVQGNDIILDADNDTSIVASSDDQIDFKAGAKIRASVNTTGLQVGGTSYFASPTLTFFDADSGVQTGTIGGRINFHTNDGTAQGVSAKIQAKYENASGNTSLSFETGTGGSTTEKMTLTSAGNLQLGSAGDFAGTDDTLQLGNGAFKIYHNGGGGNSVACMLSTANSMQIFTDVVRFTSADNSESLFGADKNSSFFAKFDNVTRFQTYSEGIQSSGNVRTGVVADRAIVSRAPLTGVTINNGSTSTVAGNNGVLHNIVLVSDGGGSGACFAMSYNTYVTKLAGSGNYTSSQNTSSSTNIYKSANSHAVTIQNLSGSDRSYFILILASYD